MIHKLYLESFTDSCDENVDKLLVTLETSVVLFVLEFVERPSCIEVYFVPSNRSRSLETGIEINRKSLNSITLSAIDFASELASNCSFPVIVSENVVIAGLSSVCRAILKYANANFRYLLGFKETCLQAPSESSPWTKFCEVDIVGCTKTILEFHQQITSSECLIEYVLPQVIGFFESHLSQPVKAHNINKLTLDIARGLEISDQQPKTNDSDGQNVTKETERGASKKSILTKNIILEHKFVEGPLISIADIIIFPYFRLIRNIFERYAIEPLETKLPLTYKWFEAVTNYPRILNSMTIFSEQSIPQQQVINYIVQESDSFTLYKRESKHNKPNRRLFTKDDNIEQALNKINQLGIEISSLHLDEHEIIEDSNWQLPYDALPEGGNLPENRLQRKKDQLFGLAREIIAIANDGDRIVDFCSGQGHLAIVLAYKLPQCVIYMLDNKEEMILRARQRVKRLKLTNIRFFQCNLDYYVGNFDIGTSLHACGIASDIVLMHCRQRNANFVCCPCCYGKVIEMPHITFPRSKFFRSNNILLNEYLCIAHCADQAHDTKNNKNNVEKSIQGAYCMDVIDTDRKLYMEEYGYNTKLTRLHPEDCTPKNRLLIGIRQIK